MRTLNLGILAHVDAGKTSLTERLLLHAGVIDELGSVDAGSTQTDSLALERRRGITIKSAVVSFVVDDVTVNLIDTPGHPDFIAEVERVLNVLDGAVLVISAVEGVQAQTRILMRALQRLRIPTLVFVNKIDRRGAHDDAVVAAIADRLGTVPVPMGSVVAIGTPSAAFVPSRPDDEDFVGRLVDLRAERDAAYLASFVDGGGAGEFGDLMSALRDRTGEAEACPVFFGSAITGAGVQELVRGIVTFLPCVRGGDQPPDRAGADGADDADRADDADDGAVSATVFKVERGPAGEKIAYVRMVRGTIRTRDRLAFGRDRDGKVTAIAVFEHGSAVARSSVCAGMIGKLWGLSDVRIGDSIGADHRHEDSQYFAPPTLETVVVPADERDRGVLRSALAQLAEQDPLIDVRQDDVRQEISVSLYGEVQKEVIGATLADEFGVRVAFRESTTICVERPTGTGEAVEVIAVDPNPFLATVGLRVEPGPAGSGVRFELDVELGSMPRSFMRAVEDTVHETLREGLLGWQVVDCLVTMTRSGYWARQSHAHGTFDASMSSTAGDFRNLTPLVLMDALRRAGTIIEEPLERFRLEIPADTLAVVLPALAQSRAVPRTSTITGSICVLDGDVPSARMYGLQQQLPSLTRGEGVLEAGFERYEPVRGRAPSRPRTDQDPLNRKDYLLRVQRRVQP